MNKLKVVLSAPVGAGIGPGLRTTRKALGDYYFSVDVEGHVADARISEAIMGLHRVCLDVRYLGSYPRHDGHAPVLRDGVTDADFAEAREWLDRLKENG